MNVFLIGCAKSTTTLNPSYVSRKVKVNSILLYNGKFLIIPNTYDFFFYSLLLYLDKLNNMHFQIANESPVDLFNASFNPTGCNNSYVPTQEEYRQGERG